MFGSYTVYGTEMADKLRTMKTTFSLIEGTKEGKVDSLKLLVFSNITELNQM
jgi:hypothetical protein